MAEEDKTGEGVKRKVPGKDLVYACLNCRALKKKCIRVEHSDPPLCKRCVDQELECVFKRRKTRVSKPKAKKPISSATSTQASGPGSSRTPYDKTTDTSSHPLGLVRRRSSSPGPRTVNTQLATFVLASSLSSHLLEEILANWPFRPVSDALYEDMKGEFEARGRNEKNFGQWGEILLTALLLGGAQTSTHSAILQVQAAERPILQGDQSFYSLARLNAVTKLSHRLRQLVFYSSITKTATMESIAILLEVVTVYLQWTRFEDADEVLRIALDQYRAVVGRPDFPEEKRQYIGVWFIFYDATLSRNLRRQVLISDEEIHRTMSWSGIDSKYLTGGKALLELSPDAKHPQMQTIVAFGSPASMRSLAVVLNTALRTRDTEEAAKIFGLALEMMRMRREWQNKYREAVAPKIIRPGELKDLNMYFFFDLVEVPFALFRALAFLETYITERRGYVSLALARVVYEYEKEVEHYIFLLSKWLKDSLTHNTLVCGSDAANKHAKICRGFDYLPGHFEYFLRYLKRSYQKDLQFPDVDRHDVVFWFAEALKPAAFYNHYYALWSTQLHHYLEAIPPPSPVVGYSSSSNVQSLPSNRQATATSTVASAQTHYTVSTSSSERGTTMSRGPSSRSHLPGLQAQSLLPQVPKTPKTSSTSVSQSPRIDPSNFLSLQLAPAPHTSPASNIEDYAQDMVQRVLDSIATGHV
ncbi:hypothetical protein BT69DRAFT_1352047 [Atractiella rhizophila]|nr:hypothetical protein BT69DRAFT_1352047 [Atractiella rhizophila]